jgi:hypothetical protein
MTRRFLLMSALTFVLAPLNGCRDSVLPARTEYVFGADGWTAGFADYHVSQGEAMALTTRIEAVPAPVGKPGHLVAGNNHSDDLFMFLKRRIDTGQDNTDFDVDVVVEFATDVPTGCGGIGGSPGESVWVKAGASGREPVPVPDALGTLRMSTDIGNQSTSGANAVVLGTVNNSLTCEMGVRRWELKTLAGSLPARSDGLGHLWILVGTDSGFEGRTEIYFTNVTAGLTPR